MEGRCPRFHISTRMTALLFGSALFLISMTASASQIITLVALINNQSALLPASWVIYTQHNQNTPVATLPRHSGTVRLPPGQYNATVEINKQIKATRFRVEPGVDSTVTVSLDIN